MDFFSACKDKEEAKKVYRTLAKCFHPDKGGNNELMLQLKHQYEKFEPRYNDFNQKRTTFYRQVFDDAKYQFNTINRNSHIPFDHPIHSLVRELNSKIEVLEGRLNIQTATSNYWHQKYLNEEKTSNELCEDYEKLEEKFNKLKNEFEEMSILDFLKLKWSKL